MKRLQYKILNCVECTRATRRELELPFLGAGCLCAKTMFIGEAPGEQTRQKNGITFCGNKSGDYFLEVAAKYNFNFSNSYFTNVVKCQQPFNAHPTSSEIGACAGYLREEIRIVDPKIIVPVGAVAARAVLRKPEDEWYSILKRAGTPVYRKKIIFPLPHPAYILRNRSYEDTYNVHWNSLRKFCDTIKTSNVELAKEQSTLMNYKNEKAKQMGEHPAAVVPEHQH